MNIPLKEYFEKNTLGKILCFISAVLLLLVTVWQLYTVLAFDCYQFADSYTYYRIAKNAAVNSTVYPAVSNLYDSQIYTPGYINYLTVLLKINGGLRFLLLCNIAVSLGIAFSVYYVSSRVFKNRNVGFISLIIFELLVSYSCAVLQLRSELLLSFAIFGGFALLLSELKFRHILAGIVFAFACWINLITVIFVLFAIIYLTINKFGTAGITKTIASLIVAVVVISSFSYYISGYSSFVSPVSGINIISSANDKTNGRYQADIFSEGEAGYIENASSKTFIEKNNILLARSSKWISSNLWKYASQAPYKLFNIYSTDSHYIRSYYINSGRIGGGSLSDVFRSVFTFDFNGLSWVDGILIFDQIIYWLALLISIVTLATYTIKRKYLKSWVPLVLFVVTSTIVYMFGATESVMHVIFMPIIIMTAASGINELLFSKFKRKSKEESYVEEIFSENVPQELEGLVQ